LWSAFSGVLAGVFGTSMTFAFFGKETPPFTLISNFPFIYYSTPPRIKANWVKTFDNVGKKDGFEAP
jgi:hypothetical protein